MDVLTWVNLICLSTVGVLASAGVFFTGYHDTLLERLGMSVVAVWSFVQVLECLLTGAPTGKAQELLYFGLALFAVGFALETRKSIYGKR